MKDLNQQILKFDYEQNFKDQDFYVSNSNEHSFKLLNSCIIKIVYGDTEYNRIDITDKDIEEFIDQLNTDQFEQIINFFNTMPKLRHVVDVVNPKTKVKSEVLLEGLQNFLG